MKERTIKKIIGLLMLMLCIKMLIPIYVEYNLSRYCIWYAQRIPHSKDSDPVFVMIAKNANFINHPKSEGFEEYRFNNEILGQNFISIVDYKENDDFDVKKTITSYSVIYARGFENGKIVYHFNDKGELIFLDRYLANAEAKTEDFTEEEKKEAYEFVYSIIQPLIDKQYFPIINLQWIFNERYYDQFNS